MENYKNLSLEETAVEVMRDVDLTFDELCKKVAEIKGMTEEEMNEIKASFYTDITASGNFVYCGNDIWSLKKNKKLDSKSFAELYKEHVSEGEEETSEERKVRLQREKERRERARRAVEEEEYLEDDLESAAEAEEEDQQYESDNSAYENQMYVEEERYDDEEYEEEESNLDDEEYDDYDLEDEEDTSDIEDYEEELDKYDDYYD